MNTNSAKVAATLSTSVDRDFRVPVKAKCRHAWRLPPDQAAGDGDAGYIAEEELAVVARGGLGSGKREPSDTRRLRWPKWVLAPVMREN